MRTSRRSRTLTARLAALSAALGAAALVGFGATAAHAGPAPTTTDATTTASTTTASTTTATTTTASTTASTTTATASTTPATTTTATTAPTTTSSGPGPEPGPQCPDSAGVQTPVLCIPANFGEDDPAQTTVNEDVFFDGQVVNNGSAVSEATIRITLPAQLQLATDFGPPVTRYEQWWIDDSNDDPVDTPLACTTTPGKTNAPGATVACATGPIAAGDNFLVDVALVGTKQAKAGTAASFSMTLAPNVSGPSFPSTSIAAEVDFLGTAHLVVTIAPHTATITVGASRTLIGTVRNDGPDPAPNVVSVGVVATGSLNGPGDPKATKDFVITNSASIPDPSGNAALVVRNATTTEPPLAFWPVGTIAAGKTASVKVTVKALAPGRATLGFAAFSDADDPQCDNEDDSTCRQEDEAALVAAAVPATTTTTATTAPTTALTQSAAPVSTSAAALPNTGFHPAPWLGSGAAAVLLGFGLILLGAPRRLRGRYR